jgi:TonB-linked SusC/RagA family outer membrane protein
MFSLTSNNVLSQNTKIKIDIDKVVTVDEVFKIISDQTDYKFIYQDNLFINAPKVHLKKGIIKANKLLEMSIPKSNINFEFTEKNTIVIKDISIDENLGDIYGNVTDEAGSPLPGVSIHVKGTIKGTNTDINGNFFLRDMKKGDIIVVSYLGYKTVEVVITDKSSIKIILEQRTEELETVNIISTGYQKISKERATGSYNKLDNKEFNYKTGAGTDVIARLENMTTGFLIARNGSNQGQGNLANLTIRGPNDIGFSSPTDQAPLIVIDDLPYTGDISNINPNDIESVTILKDAAATSIYGAKAANGVIVYVTKKGAYSKPFQLSFNTNTSISEKPDLNYLQKQRLNSSDFIDLEKILFDQGIYNWDIANRNSRTYVLTPAVEIYRQVRDEGLSQTTADQLIDKMRNYNFTDELLEYEYRDQINQQYAFDLGMGTKNLSYFFSAGYDKNLASNQGSENDRISLRSNVKFKPIKNLEISNSIFYTQRKSLVDGTISSSSGLGSYPAKLGDYYPYARLTDDAGDPAPLVYKYNPIWVATQGTLRGLDWLNVPINDVNEFEANRENNDLVLKLNVKYDIGSIIKLNTLYQYEKAFGSYSQLYKEGSFFVRDLVNNFTQNPGPNQSRPIPLGGILDRGTNSFVSQTLRQQIDFDKTWNSKHNVSAVVGGEVREDIRESQSPPTVYGYNTENGLNQVIDFTTRYSRATGGQAIIPGSQHSFGKFTQRNVSVYSAASYNYDNLYTVSFSARKDGSNLFGAKTNQKFNPFWSVGGSWNITNETFMNKDWLNYLKLSTSYGSGGNIASNQSAYLIAQQLSNDFYSGRPGARIIQLPNPDLRWMVVRTFNTRLDFGLKNNWLDGSIEYFTKRSDDILSSITLDPITGSTSQVLNEGKTSGEGVEISLHSRNLKLGDFEWNTNYLFTYNKTKIVSYEFEPSPSALAGNYVTSTIAVKEGYDAYSMFSYKFAGLDPVTGSPMGYVDGVLTTADGFNASSLVFSATEDDIEYNGSAVPTKYGAIRNSFSWKGFELSANISYKFNYYFRKGTIAYYDLQNNWGGVHSEYNDRWQQPGDELITSVPSAPSDFTDWTLGYRDLFYKNSSANVAKGDHIRFQDVNLGYTFNEPALNIKSLRLYLNVTNLGILWRANDWGLDPDIFQESYPSPRTVTFGLSANF